MKFYQIIKVTLLILLLSSNLMLGQKRNMQTKEVRIKQCFENPAENKTEQNEVVELRLLQTPPNFRVTLPKDCSALDSPDLGSFFQFTAF